jgi:hypothetical protein
MICDFSLAKVVVDLSTMPPSPKKAGGKSKKEKKKKQKEGGAAGAKHTEGMGTATYTAPEIVNGACPLSHNYACVLYMLISFRPKNENNAVYALLRTHLFHPP